MLRLCWGGAGFDYRVDEENQFFEAFALRYLFCYPGECVLKEVVPRGREDCVTGLSCHGGSDFIIAV